MSARTAQDILNKQKKNESDFLKLLSKITRKPNSYSLEEPEQNFICLFQGKEGHICDVFCKMNKVKSSSEKLTQTQKKFSLIQSYKSKHRPEKCDKKIYEFLESESTVETPQKKYTKPQRLWKFEKLVESEEDEEDEEDEDLDMDMDLFD